MLKNEDKSNSLELSARYKKEVKAAKFYPHILEPQVPNFPLSQTPNPWSRGQCCIMNWCITGDVILHSSRSETLRQRSVCYTSISRAGLATDHETGSLVGINHNFPWVLDGCG
ncbi:hypothetical protein Pfo_013065 [Paulownia fortunei]|nr:hypothetical protein Pfo_013065 [Paulownia fortunei]